MAINSSANELPSIVNENLATEARSFYSGRPFGLFRASVAISSANGQPSFGLEKYCHRFHGSFALEWNCIFPCHRWQPFISKRTTELWLSKLLPRISRIFCFGIELYSSVPSVAIILEQTDYRAFAKKTLPQISWIICGRL